MSTTLLNERYAETVIVAAGLRDVMYTAYANSHGFNQSIPKNKYANTK